MVSFIATHARVFFLRAGVFFAAVLRDAAFLTAPLPLRLAVFLAGARLRAGALRGALAARVGVATGAGDSSEACAVIRLTPVSASFSLTGLPPHISSRP